MKTLTKVRTGEQVQAEFKRAGISAASWAIANGFIPKQVYDVLSGKSKCRIGAGHEIAVRLGMKEGVVGVTPRDFVPPPPTREVLHNPARKPAAERAEQRAVRGVR